MTDLPELRSTPNICPFGSCPVVLVDWVKKYTTTPPKKLEQQQHTNLGLSHRFEVIK